MRLAEGRDSNPCVGFETGCASRAVLRLREQCCNSGDLRQKIALDPLDFSCGKSVHAVHVMRLSSLTMAILPAPGPATWATGALGGDSAMLLQPEEIDMRKNASSSKKSNKPETAKPTPTKTTRVETARTRAGQVRTNVPAPTARDGSKMSKLIALLRAPSGATIETMMKATGWQAHSVRGALSGAIGKKLGLKVVSEKVGDVRVYRIAGN